MHEEAMSRSSWKTHISLTQKKKKLFIINKLLTKSYTISKTLLSLQGQKNTVLIIKVNMSIIITVFLLPLFTVNSLFTAQELKVANPKIINQSVN